MGIVTARSPRAFLGGALASLIATLALTVPAAAGGPTTRYVDNTGPSCGDGPTYLYVQQAIDLSSAGDTVVVCPGEYVDPLIVDKDDLTIRGFEPWTASIVSAPDIDDGNLITVDSVEGTLIKWLEIVAPTEEDCGQVGTLISVENSPDTRIRANHLHRWPRHPRRPCGYDTGIIVSQSHGTVVAWNRIIDFQDFGIAVLTSATTSTSTATRYASCTPPGPRGSRRTPSASTSSRPRARVANNVVRSLPSAGDSTPRLSRGIGVDFWRPKRGSSATASSTPGRG